MIEQDFEIYTPYIGLCAMREKSEVHSVANVMVHDEELSVGVAHLVCAFGR
jgi:hypothetical protein